MTRQDVGRCCSERIIFVVLAAVLTSASPATAERVAFSGRPVSEPVEILRLQAPEVEPVQAAESRPRQPAPRSRVWMGAAVCAAGGCLVGRFNAQSLGDATRRHCAAFAAIGAGVGALIGATLGP